MFKDEPLHLWTSGSAGASPHPFKHLLVEKTLENQWESEAPAELRTPRFGRSLTLPSNELVE